MATLIKDTPVLKGEDVITFMEKMAEVYENRNTPEENKRIAEDYTRLSEIFKDNS